MPPSKPKRIRRKCSAPSCPNRVVQGGVCVTHGAKRKLCLHAGCDKAVKLAGYCSTHGPARKKCDEWGCTRVAVQGGKCLSHGAKRRICKFPKERCNKNAIVGGMCKKHYDMMKDANGLLETFGEEQVGHPVPGHPVPGHPVPPLAMPAVPQLYRTTAPPVAPAPPVAVTYTSPLKKNKHPRHQRGLSIFEEMGTVDAIINSGAASQQEVVLPEAADRDPTADPAIETSMMPPPPAKSQLPTTSTRTPAPQVSFADTSYPAKLPSKQLASKPTEAEYYSPTIAIFEQMIKASEVIEKPPGSHHPPGYAGLSPPKLHPRGRRHVSFHHETRRPKAPPRHVVNHADLPRTVSRDEEHHSTVPLSQRVSSPTNERRDVPSRAPETPDLDPSEPNIVSAGSHSAEGPQALLPQRNAEYEHLFIPR